MSPISATELDLLTFFEAEPSKRDAEVPWLYNDLLYEWQQESLSLTFAVAPSYKDVRIILKQADAAIYELNAVGVEDVRYHNDGGREALEVIIAPHDRLWISLKPHVFLGHEAKEQSGPVE